MGMLIFVCWCAVAMVMKACCGSDTFDLDFTSPSKTGFVQLDVVASFTDLSVCLWLQCGQSLSKNGTQGIVSYHKTYDQSFTMTIRRGRLVMKIFPTKQFIGLDNPVIQSSLPVDDGKWRHLCVVWDRANNGILTLYVDGQMDVTKQYDAWPLGQVISGGGRLIIGKVITSLNHELDLSDSNGSFTGILSGLTIWDKAMTFEHVLEMFQECSIQCFLPANMLMWNRRLIKKSINGSLIIKESVTKCSPLSSNSNFMQFNGKRLQGHVIQRKRVPSTMTCALWCLSNLACKSFNIVKTNNNRLDCELNRIIKDEDPEIFRTQALSVYGEKKFQSCRGL